MQVDESRRQEAEAKRQEAEVKEMKRSSRGILFALLATMAFMLVYMWAFGGGRGVYTLYRDSPTDKAMRLHFATFDALGEEKQDEENCIIVRDLMHRQSRVTARYWCEKGTFRK
jgi:hypothetical protein